MRAKNDYSSKNGLHYGTLAYNEHQAKKEPNNAGLGREQLTIKVDRKGIRSAMTVDRDKGRSFRT